MDFDSLAFTLGKVLLINHILVTSVVFFGTMVLIFKRPWNLHESIATVIGGTLMLIFQMVTFEQAGHAVAGGLDVMIFLLALMILSTLLDEATFFEWCALNAASAAKGSGKVLFRNVFLVGAATTAFLSLDTTAIILTPIITALVKRLNLKSMPYLIACAFVSNTGSLLLPVSNLTNLLLQHEFSISFASFFTHMLVPQVLALVLNYMLFAWIFREAINHEYPSDLPPPSSCIKNKIFFTTSLVILPLILVGYFISSLLSIPPYMVAFAGCLILLVAGLSQKCVQAKTIFRGISWELFPFLIGLFVMIAAVENLGLAKNIANYLSTFSQHKFAEILTMAGTAALGSNVINNVPMALLSISILKSSHASSIGQFAALLGCNLGPNLTVTGSLATMLVITAARKRGETLTAMDFFKTGALVTPVLIVVTSIALWATFKVIGGN